jgi:hypothetical protein
MDARAIAVRKDGVLRTPMPAHDVERLYTERLHGEEARQ